MHWFKSTLKSSLHAIFGSGQAPASEDGEAQASLEDIRSAMLALISETGEDRFPHVTRRIRYAADIQALWFLRGDLMAVLANHHGEAVAREKIESVSDIFDDMLPRGLRSRPSPLSSTFRD